MKTANISVADALEMAAQHKTDLLQAMVLYLLEVGTVTEARIRQSLFQVKWEDKPMDPLHRTASDIINSVGAVRLIVHQLNCKFGEIDDETQLQIAALPMSKLLQLGEALLGFDSPVKLNKWLRRHVGKAGEVVKKHWHEAQQT